jgi:hypothetical protein
MSKISLIPNILDAHEKKTSIFGDLYMILATFQDSINWLLLKYIFI